MKELAPYYYLIYWFIVLLFTINKFSSLYNLRRYQVFYQWDYYRPLVIFSIFFIIFYGYRPVAGAYLGDVNFFGDTRIYANIYNNLQQTGVLTAEQIGSDWIFSYLMYYCTFFLDVNGFFTLVLLIYIALMFWSCNLLDARHGATLMLFCFGAFSFYGYAINGIRNGAACSLVIIAMAAVCRGSRIWPVILSFIAIGIHKSTALPLLCMFFTFFVRNPKLMYLVWGGSVVLSMFLGESISNIISLISYDERLADNLSAESIGDEGEILAQTGFRWDFLIYGAMPILIGWYTLFVRKVYNHTYLVLLGTYIYANTFWVLVNRSYFSNRFAYLSWFIYPIVLAYPLFNLPVFEKNHSQKTALILLAHFGFTTLMWMMGK